MAVRGLLILALVSTLTLASNLDGLNIGLGHEANILELRDEMIEEENKLDELKRLLENSLDQNDEDKIKEIQDEASKLFYDLQVKWDILSQVYEITKHVEDAIEATMNQYPDFFEDSTLKHRAEEMMEGLHDPTTTGTPTSTEDKAEKDAEDPLAHAVGKRDAEQLRNLISNFKSAERKSAVLSDIRKNKRTRSKSTKVRSCSSMPESSWLSTWVDQKITEIDNAKYCVRRVKESCADVKAAIDDFHEIAGYAARLNTAINGLDAVLIPLSRLPMVGTVATACRAAMTPIKSGINRMEPNIRRIDRRLYPGVRTAVETARARAEQLEGQFNSLSNGLEDFLEDHDYRIGCLCGRTYSYYGHGNTIMEDLSGRVRTATGRSTIDDVSAVVHPACSGIFNLITILRDRLNINAIANFRNILEDLVDAIDPILSIFEEIEFAFEQELCMPDPIESAAEFFSGWRRKRRSISGESRPDNVFLGKTKAVAFLERNRDVKAAQICLSVNTILDGVSAAFDFLLGWAQDIINDLLDQIPGFDDLSLPDFNFDFNYFDSFNVNLNYAIPSFNVPSLGFLPRWPSLPGGICIRIDIPTSPWGKKRSLLRKRINN